jgi:hypothetical protein
MLRHRDVHPQQITERAEAHQDGEDSCRTAVGFELELLTALPSEPTEKAWKSASDFSVVQYLVLQLMLSAATNAVRYQWAYRKPNHQAAGQAEQIRLSVSIEAFPQFTSPNHDWQVCRVFGISSRIIRDPLWVSPYRGQA